MSSILQEILSSSNSPLNEDTAFSLALYFALDIDKQFYHYEASSNEQFILQLVDFFVNRIAAIDVYGANMFSKRPIHLLKYKQPFFDGRKSTLAFYSNGAVCIDQLEKDMLVHVWIQKDIVELHAIPKPDDLKAV